MIPKFTTSCFIRKNTYELCKKLEELGYKKSYFFNNTDNWIICNPSGYSSSLENIIILGEYDSFDEEYFDSDEEFKDYGIDCGINEQLFLALAALREDSDKFQWFTDVNDWFLCWSEDITKYPGYNYWHKATPEELIEHWTRNL